MRSIPVWFDSGGLGTAGRLDLPDDGGARAGVLVCPPVGNELISAHDTLRLLAEDLAGRGFAVLRFDYPGTGDSVDGPPGGDQVPLWLQAITAAISYLRSSGMERVVLVGMRLGATMAAMAAAHESVDAVVLWDPCVTGRAFLRQQASLARLVAMGDQPGDAAPVEIPGYVYSPATASHMAQLGLHDAGPRLADAVLVLLRPSVPVGTVIAPFDEVGLTVERIEGQPELLDVSSVKLEMPWATVGRIADWLDATVAGGSRPVTVSSPDRVVVDAARGVTERFVHLGPEGLFAVSTEPDDAADVPTIVFLNTANEVHIGPARQWVEMARALAGHGFSSVRVDLSGLGDSPVRPDEEPRQVYGPHLLSDVGDVTRAVAGGGAANVILVGLCSGAFAALTAGTALGVRGVVAISPVLGVHVRPLLMDPQRRGDGGSPVSLARPRNRLGAALLRNESMRDRVSRLPPSWWRVAHALHVQRSPADGFQIVVDRVGDTLVVCNAEDAHPYLDQGGWIVDRLTQTGRFRLESVEVDHSLLERQGREQVVRSVIEHLVSRYLATYERDAEPRLGRETTLGEESEQTMRYGALSEETMRDESVEGT